MLNKIKNIINHLSIKQVFSKTSQWFLGHGLTIACCVLITGLGIVFLVLSSPQTTTIGEDISTGKITATEVSKNIGEVGASYIIYQDGGTIYAKNGSTGKIEFSGTDATTVINNAIGALTAGGTVSIKEGTYSITSSINLASNVALVGAGAGTVLRIPDGHDADLNVVYGNGVDRVLVADLRIDGNRANQAAGNMTGIYFETVTHSKVEGCWVENMFTDWTAPTYPYAEGIYLGSTSDNNTVTGNTCQGNDSNGIYIYTSNNNTITGNTCQANANGIYLYDSSSNNTVTGNTCQGNSAHGISLYNSSDNTVTGNTCQGNGDVGIYLGSTSDNNTVTGNTCQGNGSDGIGLFSSSNNNTVTGNTCSNNGIGIFLYSSSSNTVTGNTCQGNNDHGIYLGISSNNTVTGNISQGNGEHGIFVGTSSGNTVSGNTVSGNSQGGDNTCSGIFIDDDSDYNNVQGNTVRHAGGANQHQYGVLINNNTCDGNLVIDNDLYQSGATADYSDAGTATVYHNNRLTVGWTPQSWHHDGTKIWDNTAAPDGWTDMDLSSYVGANRALVMLKIKNREEANSIDINFRTNGETDDFWVGVSSEPSIYPLTIVYIIVETDENGVIEWRSSSGYLVDVWLLGYIK